MTTSAHSPQLLELLDQSSTIDVNASEHFNRLDWTEIPGKPAVYLLLDCDGGAVLLATVGNLRAALQRRLADTPADQKSKRVEYGRICRAVRFREVHSAFAANWYYYQAARLLFPQTYPAMISWRAPFWVAVDSAAQFPRFVRENKPSEPGTIYLGPIQDKDAAAKLIQSTEDLFDLCRYYTILQQSPAGKACAYKEMGKCPAPCDGSVTMEHYRGQIRAAVEYLTDRDVSEGVRHPRTGYMAWRRDQEKLMTVAAAGLEFEKAARIKSRLERGAILEQPQFAHLDRLSRFAHLALQPGQGRPWIEPFFIHGGTIEAGEAVKRKELAGAAEAWFARCRELAARPVEAPLTKEAIEQIALVTHHLVRGPDDAGIYLPMHYIGDAGTIERAALEIIERRTPVKPMAEQSSDTGEILAPSEAPTQP